MCETVTERMRTAVFTVATNGYAVPKRPSLDDHLAMCLCVVVGSFHRMKDGECPGGERCNPSISVPSERYPNPIAAWTITTEFGFTAWNGKSETPPKDWLFDINKKEHCVVVVQRVK